MLKTARYHKSKMFVLLSVVAVAILLLTTLNIKKYFAPPDVLGTKTQVSEELSDNNFWVQFLSNNPDYIPGWIEVGRIDKVKEIDPNYLIP